MGAPAPWRETEAGIELSVRLTPRARSDRIEGVTVEADGRAWLAARVSAPPERGKANKALVKLLAKRLAVAASAVTIVAGATQRQKRLRIEGDPAALAARVAALSLRPGRPGTGLSRGRRERGVTTSEP
jgi:hypothetical protein